MNFILFSKTKEEYGFLSNFSKHPIMFDDKKYQTSEALFQTFKFNDDNEDTKEYKEFIRITDSPGKCACLGRQKKHRFGSKWKIQKSGDILINDVIEKYKENVKLRKDWNEVRVEIMKKVIHLKFDQNPELKEKLLKTPPNTIFVEHTKRDKFWGDGGDKGDGKIGMNMLGKIITEYINENRK
jgi:predicted NAD-dependent protein-ADP-ribosyltransferase YbiA (DUF1768 family)